MLEISAALAGLRASLDLAKLGLSARDDSKVQAAVIDANAKLLDLMTVSMALAESNARLMQQQRALEDELRRVKAQAEERERYTLTELRPGAFAYLHRPPQGGDAGAPHYLCQPCYDKGIKAVLRKTSEFSYSPPLWGCPENPKHSIEVNGPEG